MHISEGMLSVPVLTAGWGVAAAGIALGLNKTKPEAVIKLAALSAVMFVISLVRVPVGPGSVHLMLFGMMGVFLGISVVPAAFVTLLLQALLFQFGGLAVLGVNTVTVSVAALAASAIVKCMPRCMPPLVTGFLAGFIAVIVAAFAVAMAIFLSDSGFIATIKLILIANIPLALVEGVITAFVLVLLKKR